MPPGAFRLLLATVVVVHHSCPSRLGGWAVGMFFVLSGYWISKMWDEKYRDLPRPMTEFLVSRWWRLAPLFVLAQASAAALASLGGIEDSQHLVTSGAWWLTQFSVLGSCQVGLLLPPSWSLDVESQFYLLAPLILIGLSRLSGFRHREPARTVGSREAELSGPAKSWIGLTIAVAFFWSLGVMLNGVSVSAPRLDVHLWMFLVGCCASRLRIVPGRRGAALSAALLLAIVLLVLVNPGTRPLVWHRGATESSVALVPQTLFYVVTISVAIPFALATTRIKSGAFDRYLGDLSYPLYLFHWFPRVWYYDNVDWSRPFWSNLELLAVNFVAAFALAIFCLQVVDKPIQAARRNWLQRL